MACCSCTERIKDEKLLQNLENVRLSACLQLKIAYIFTRATTQHFPLLPLHCGIFATDFPLTFNFFPPPLGRGQVCTRVISNSCELLKRQSLLCVFFFSTLFLFLFLCSTLAISSFTTLQLQSYLKLNTLCKTRRRRRRRRQRSVWKLSDKMAGLLVCSNSVSIVAIDSLQVWPTSALVSYIVLPTSRMFS